jgi:hypothetical protein
VLESVDEVVATSVENTEDDETRIDELAGCRSVDSKIVTKT